MSSTIPFVDRIATLKVRPSFPDHRDYLSGAMPPMQLPSSATTGVTVPVKDQKRQGSCTGNGYSSMVEALLLLAGKPYDEKSRAMIYAMERIAEGDLDRDAGAQPIDGCKVLTDTGVCGEPDMPYNDQVFNRSPSQQAIVDAASCKIGGYALATGSLALKTAIYLTATGQKVETAGIGIAVYPSFERVGADGVVPMPLPNEGPLGGHFVYAGLSYQDDAFTEGGGMVECQNSWSDAWGKRGHMFIPYAYFDNPQYCFECRVAWL